MNPRNRCLNVQRARRGGTLLVLTLGLAAAAPAHAGLVYATGFEPPAFSPGPISGQDGWFNGGDIQSAIVQAGTQALHLDSTGGSILAGHSVSMPSSDQSVTIAFDMLQTGATNVQFGLGVTGGQIACIGQLGCHIGNANSSTPYVSAASGAWHHFMLDFDFTTMSLSGTIDAQPLGTLPINSIDSADDITLFAPYSFGSGTAHDVYYDNISVTSVPEPGSIALLGLGCFWAARRRRK